MKSLAVQFSWLTLSTLERGHHGTMLGYEQLLEIRLVVCFLTPWPATVSLVSSSIY